MARTDATKGADCDIGVLADDLPDLSALSATLAADLRAFLASLRDRAG